MFQSRHAVFGLGLSLVSLLPFSTALADTPTAARQAQLEVMGYAVRVERQDKGKAEYRVQVDSAARRLIDQSLLARLRESFPGLQHQFLPCQSVAN